MPSGAGASGASHASVQALRSMRAGLPVSDRERRVSRRAGREELLLHGRRGLGLVGGEPHRAAPHALGAERQRRRHLPAGGDAAGGEHRRRRHRVDDLRHQHHGGDLAGVTAALGALRDDEVDAGLLVRDRVIDATGERRHRDARRVRPLDQPRRRRAERRGDQRRRRVRSDTSISGAMLFGSTRMLRGRAARARRLAPAAAARRSARAARRSTRGARRAAARADSRRVEAALLGAHVLARDQQVDAERAALGLLADPRRGRRRAARACGRRRRARRGRRRCVTAATTSRQWVKAKIGKSIPSMALARVCILGVKRAERPAGVKEPGALSQTGGMTR